MATLLVLMLCSVGMNASAQNKPIQLALFNPVQIFPENTSISGIRLSLLYGKNVSVGGLDWGLVNETTSGQSVGWKLGLVGLNSGSFVGLQTCFVNLTEGSAEGVQWGFYNHAGRMSGFQLGLVNECGSMNGIQIGLVNIIKAGGQFPVFPIVNWSF